MPFTLRLTNPVDAMLGKAPPIVEFDFKDEFDGSKRAFSREELYESKTLSQGETRALHLLNFIFDMEDRAQRGEDSLIIIDDPADSLDYKNKHAILQYLKDLSEIERFRLIILTHNFDFYRSLSERVVHRDRCYMANQHLSAITLEKAEGIQNIFIKKWRKRVHQDPDILYASVSFVRNLIEYVSGEGAPNFKDLCQLLHWQDGTERFTVDRYIEIYNKFFSEDFSCDLYPNDKSMVVVLFERADEISKGTSITGIDLKQKVLLSIAI
tara:strand:- start:52 stop:855 length:804 start_codon:yes stop_codon:yes gene_type:complete